MKNQYKEITEVLRKLVETHDFIVIPNFGAFVMQLESAEFSMSENILLPPRKKVLFNPLLKHNDGLLITEVQKKLGIEYILAETMVNQFVQTLYLMLDTKQRVDVEEIGFFYKDIAGNIVFESTLNPFYLSESFGLSPIHAIPIEKPVIFQPNLNTTKDAPVKVISINRKNIYKAAVLISVILMLLAYWYIAPLDIQTNWANIVGTRPLNTNIPINHREYPLFKTKYNELTLTKKVLAVTDLPINTAPDTHKHSTTFSIIVGCFRLEENAKRLILDLNTKNIKANLKWNPEKQLFVVSIGSFESKPKAIETLNGLKINGTLKDAWIKEE